MRKLKIPAFSMFAIVALSVLATAALIAFPLWTNGSTTIAIEKGQSATFNVGIGSPQPPIYYSVYLYDDAGNFVNTVKSATLSGSTYDTVTITPGDYNDVAGTYKVFITASDVDDGDWNQELTLIVTEYAPVFSSIPSISMAVNSVYILNLNSYVTDADDLLSSLTWTITGNTLAAADITGGILTLTSGSTTGTDTLNLTVCDPSNECASVLVTLTITNAVPNPLFASEPRELNVKNIGLQAFGDSMLLVRNHGLRFENVRIRVDFDSMESPYNAFTFTINPNTVKYLVLDTPGVKSGDYLIKVYISTQDSSAAEYMILSV